MYHSSASYDSRKGHIPLHPTPGELLAVSRRVVLLAAEVGTSLTMSNVAKEEIATAVDEAQDTTAPPQAEVSEHPVRPRCFLKQSLLTVRAIKLQNTLRFEQS